VFFPDGRNFSQPQLSIHHKKMNSPKVFPNFAAEIREKDGEPADLFLSDHARAKDHKLSLTAANSHSGHNNGIRVSP
jgi:hypothetical protein